MIQIESEKIKILEKAKQEQVECNPED